MSLNDAEAASPIARSELAEFPASSLSRVFLMR